MCLTIVTPVKLWHSGTMHFTNSQQAYASRREKKVKHTKLPSWLIQDIAHRDELKREKQFDLCKKQRGEVSTLVRKAKENYFDKLVTDNRHAATI